MRIFACLIAAAALSTFPYLVCAEEKEPDETEDLSAGDVIAVDPVGEPVSHIKRPRNQGQKLFIWWENGVWHIRSWTRANPHKFEGRISISGGKVTKIFNLQWLETTGKHRDMGTLDKTRTIIPFRFFTKGGEDGFDFTLSPNAENVQFELKMDGHPHPEVVAVGKRGMPAPNAAFTLPAHPDEEKQ